MATIANGGVHHTPVLRPEGRRRPTATSSSTRATDPGDRVLDRTSPTCEQNVLRGVVTGGTGTKADVDGHELFGKTGTTDNRADAWFIGATPQLATAVWFGNRTGNQLPAPASAATRRRPIFAAFMSQALDGSARRSPLPDPGPGVRTARGRR